MSKFEEYANEYKHVKMDVSATREGELRRTLGWGGTSPPHARFLRSSMENTSNLRLVGGAGGIRTDGRLCSRSVSHPNASNRRCQED
jgi:hypothetical protein